MNVNKQIQLLILSRLGRSVRYAGKRVLSCSLQNRVGSSTANTRAQPLGGRCAYVAFPRNFLFTLTRFVKAKYHEPRNDRRQALPIVSDGYVRVGEKGSKYM